LFITKCEFDNTDKTGLLLLNVGMYQPPYISITEIMCKTSKPQFLNLWIAQNCW